MGNYCEQLRAALEQLGLVTAENSFLEGSDNVGFLVARTAEQLAAGAALITQRESEPEATADDTDDWWIWFFDTLDQLRDIGVHEIEQDWKHFEWSGETLEILGVRIEMVSESIEKDEQIYRVAVWREA